MQEVREAPAARGWRERDGGGEGARVLDGFDVEGEGVDAGAVGVGAAGGAAAGEDDDGAEEEEEGQDEEEEEVCHWLGEGGGLVCVGVVVVVGGGGEVGVADQVCVGVDRCFAVEHAGGWFSHAVCAGSRWQACSIGLLAWIPRSFFWIRDRSM